MSFPVWLLIERRTYRHSSLELVTVRLLRRWVWRWLRRP